MKVICAGAPRTGTKSMAAALRHLGYSVYDFEDQMFTHGKEWLKILTQGGTKEEFYKLYKDIDAVVDQPAFYYWKELHEAFPNAKIILMTRELESWFQSFLVLGEIFAKQSAFQHLLAYILPTLILFSRVGETSIGVIFGILPQQMCKPWHINRKIIFNEQILKRRFTEHNNQVKQLAPADKLLIFEPSQGWEPLCKFLGKEIPKIEFPHLNKGARVIEKVRLKELERQIQKELIVFVAILVAVISIMVYFFFM